MTQAAEDTVELVLPACWKGPAAEVLRATGEERARIVHPRCDARQHAVALALAVALSSAGEQPALLVGPDASIAACLLYAQGQPDAFEVKGGEVRCGGAVVHTKRPRQMRYAAIVTVDAHEVPHEDKQLERLQAPRRLLLSAPTQPGHWARAWPALQVWPDAVLASFPDQELALLEYGASDVAERGSSRPPFGRFAAQRLRVRTDKPREFLTRTQQEAAQQQLGDRWFTGRMGVPIVPLELSRMQRRYLAAKRRALALGKPARFLLLKYRRGGFTTLEQALSYYDTVTSPNSSCITLAHTRESTARIFRIVETFFEKDHRAPRRGNDSRTSFEFENGSSFFIGTAGGKGVGRGDTLRRVHGSEVSKWCEDSTSRMQDVDDLIAGLVGAASHGEVVLETTPNGVEWFCATYRDAKRELNDWTPIFLPWFLDPTNRAAQGTFTPEEVAATLSAEEKALVSKHGLDVSQVAFRRAKQREYGRLFRQEFPEDEESCFITSGTCYFSVDRVTALLDAGLPEPARVEERRGARLTVWEEPEPGVEYVAGCDTSEGIPGCDPNGVGVLRRDTGAQVASLHGYLSPPALADAAAKLSQHYNGALLGVERQNHGHAVLLKLRELGFDKPHFLGGSLYYCHRGSDIGSSRAGWDTNSNTRDAMLSELAEAVEAGSMVVRDREFLAECLAFRLQPSGKWEADPGAHDDSVVKWAIAWQMRHHRRQSPRITVI